jgi:hypothetical protein
MTHPDWIVSAARAVPAEIWRPLIDTREGMKRTAAWYRRNGWV